MFLDDVIVWGNSPSEHNSWLREVLKKAQRSGLKLNKKKLSEFRVKELTYLGDKLSGKGVQPDPEKTRAIEEMPQPTNKTELQRALGLINYMGRFIPNLSANTKALMSLLEEKTEWQQSHEHTHEWEWLKSSLTTEHVLKFYDSSKPVRPGVHRCVKRWLGSCTATTT